MRIGIIAHLKHPIGEPFAGGLETHTHLIATSLKARGHEVTVFASTHSDASLGLEAICDETDLNGVGVDEAPDVAFFREHHAYLSLLNDLRSRDFDVIHNNALHYLPVAMADALPMPMITTLHTPPFCWLESGVRVARGQNNSFVGISESIRSTWAAITPIDRVILNGIDLKRFGFAPRSSEDAYLVWYGRIVPEKGLHFAIDAARKLDMPLRIAGPMSDTTYFEREIAPRLGQGAVYLGHLGHDALAPLIGGARASLCTPCWDEPYGLVVAESLACGVPVAAFARGAIPEILTAQCGVLAHEESADALAEAARAAVALSRTACRARAEAMCDANHMIDAYERLYVERVTERQGVQTKFPIAVTRAAWPSGSISVDRALRLGPAARELSPAEIAPAPVRGAYDPGFGSDASELPRGSGPRFVVDDTPSANASSPAASGSSLVSS